MLEHKILIGEKYAIKIRIQLLMSKMLESKKNKKEISLIKYSKIQMTKRIFFKIRYLKALLRKKNEH